MSALAGDEVVNLADFGRACERNPYLFEDRHHRRPDAALARCDALPREGLSMERYERVAAPAEANKAQADLDSLLAEHEAVEATLEVADATGEFAERIAALRSAVAGDITAAESVRATQVALRRVFNGFAMHRADSPDAPRRLDAELGLGVKGYVVEPRVAEDARLGTNARRNPGRQPRAAVTGIGQLTPVPPRPQ